MLPTGKVFYPFFLIMETNKNIKIGDLISWAGECYIVQKENFAKFEMSALWRNGVVLEITKKFIVAMDSTSAVFKIPLKNNAVAIKRVSKIEG